MTNFNRGTAAPGPGDIFVNDAVSWTAAPSTTTLTLNALRDVNVNRAITATNGNLVVCCGRDVNVNAALTTVNGSILLSAGRNSNLNAAITTTDGNLTVCAGHDVIVSGALTLTRGSSIPSQSLGLPLGLVLRAGNDGSGPGVIGGTVVFAPLTPPAAVTGPNAPVSIFYNPISYATPTTYLANFTLVTSSLTQFMLVFPGGGDKTFDSTTVATLAGFNLETVVDRSLCYQPLDDHILLHAANDPPFGDSATGRIARFWRRMAALQLLGMEQPFRVVAPCPAPP